MVGIICSFFGVGSLESTGDSIISLIMTEVGGVGVLIPRGILQRRSCKFSSQFFLDPIDIALWLLPAWVLGGHRLAAMQSFLCTTSLSIQIMPWPAKLWNCALSTLQLNRVCLSPLWHNEQTSQLKIGSSMFSRTMWLSWAKTHSMAFKRMRGMRNLGSSPPL